MRKYFLFSVLLFAQLARADVRQFIDQGDILYKNRTETTGAQDAAALYDQALAEEPESVEAMWKAARALYWVAYHASIKKEKIQTFEKGIGLAERAVQANPKLVEPHFWLAALYGSYGETKGVLKSLALVKPIRKELDTINQIDEEFQGGAGHRVLGIVDYKVPGFAGGNKKRAAEALAKALQIAPAHVFNLYYMAEFQGLSLGKKKEALPYLDQLSTSQPTADVDAADLKMMQQKGDALRRQLGL